MKTNGAFPFLFGLVSLLLGAFVQAYPLDGQVDASHDWPNTGPNFESKSVDAYPVSRVIFGSGQLC